MEKELTRITTNSVMTSGVSTDEAGGEVALHVVLELANGVLIEDQVKDLVGISVLLRNRRGKIATKAARIVLTASGSGSDVHRDGGGDRSEIDDHVLERTGLDTSSTSSIGEGDDASNDGTGVLAKEFSVAAEGVFRAVEKVGAEGIVGSFSPVPVRLVASVAALVAEGLLKSVDVPPVPVKEVSLQRYPDQYAFEILEFRVYLQFRGWRESESYA